jgi:hypothetical protein
VNVVQKATVNDNSGKNNVWYKVSIDNNHYWVNEDAFVK